MQYQLFVSLTFRLLEKKKKYVTFEIVQLLDTYLHALYSQNHSGCKFMAGFRVLENCTKYLSIELQLRTIEVNIGKYYIKHNIDKIMLHHCSYLRSLQSSMTVMFLSLNQIHNKCRCVDNVCENSVFFKKKECRFFFSLLAG